MRKYADIITKLQPHQERALRRALLRNLILAHSTGSGKTLTSIAIADALGKPTTVLTPASLVENYKKELLKHKKGGPAVDVWSLPTAVKRNLQVPKGNTLIIDEAHALRNNGTARQQYVKEQLDNADRVFALTGTPAYNNIADWAPLVNIVAKEDVFPNDPDSFRERYLDQIKRNPTFTQRLLYGMKPWTVSKLKRKEELRDKLQKYVDVFYADVDKPQRKDVVVHTGMTPEQLLAYKMVERDMPRSLLEKVRSNIPPSKSEAVSLNAFLTGVRQVSNTPEEYSMDSQPGEKLVTAVNHLVNGIKHNPDFKALVYSNYIGSGVNPYARLLDKAKIPYGIFTGAQSQAQKKHLVDDYNNGLIKVLLASGSGSEGIDLKNTRLIQLLEPHWNNSRLEQVVGRGIRYKSHESLPPDQRNVLVEHYISDLPEEKHLFYTKKPTSVDNYLSTRAAENERLMNEVKDLFNAK